MDPAPQTPARLQARIQSSIDRLGMTLDSHSHHRMTGVAAYRFSVGDYRIIYDFDRAKGVFHRWQLATGLKGRRGIIGS
jgi:mRNA-degrading endonuclease RelE of RelBE toxin-antitoxin system